MQCRFEVMTSYLKKKKDLDCLLQSKTVFFSFVFD